MTIMLALWFHATTYRMQTWYCVCSQHYASPPRSHDDESLLSATRSFTVPCARVCPITRTPTQRGESNGHEHNTSVRQ